MPPTKSAARILVIVGTRSVISITRWWAISGADNARGVITVVVLGLFAEKNTSDSLLDRVSLVSSKPFHAFTDMSCVVGIGMSGRSRRLFCSARRRCPDVLIRTCYTIPPAWNVRI